MSTMLSWLVMLKKSKRAVTSSNFAVTIHFVPFISSPYTSSHAKCVRVECEDEGAGKTKCNGTKQMGQNEWDEVNVGRNDRVPKYIQPSI